ncbi:MAG: hypothetical protein LC745_00430 [Planctomycetia bacterium]|nr:hypothetical protein [Planctomycetia bacterium]
MRKMIPLLAVTLLTGVSLAIAAEVKTITGDAVCAKCALKEQPKCQNVVISEDGGKKTNYYLTGAASKKAHQALGICTASKDAPVKVKVTGDVQEKDGKQTVEVTKIDKAD